ncbi:hypothetical protein ACFSTA_01425 [Ornithinibacillus salinisoli]|uniref:Uncharacterized protein n=1 Tax=Ornithinibacillus salinisoli TaxID=1848459 RepID=A0ABW4VTV0_9BACI
MKKNREFKDIIAGKKGLIISTYIGFMLMFYLGYILLEIYRLNNSEQWRTTKFLTQEDIQSIRELGTWTSIPEFLFLGLFLLASILLFRYRKNKRVLSHFIIINLFLFLAIFLIGYLLSTFITAPIGNLTQPLILPTFFLLVMIVMYAGYMMKKWRTGKYIK